MKKIVYITMIALAAAIGVSALLTPRQANAMARFSAADATYIRKDEVIDGSVYIAGNSVTVDGTIKGDLYCAGQSVTITGTVDGDIICAGQSVEISGKAGGSMRLAGQLVRLRGESGGSVSVFAQSLETENTTKIGKDLNGAVTTARLAGNYGRDITLSAEEAVVVGTVARDVEGAYSTLRIANGSRVSGNVSYSSPQDGVIEGSVEGKVSRTPITRQGQSGAVAGTILTMLGIIASGLILVLFIALVMPRRMDDAMTLARKKPGRVALWGLGAFAVLPLVTLVLMLSGVGISVAIMLGATWMLFAIFGGVFVAYLVGTVLFKKVKSIPLRALLGGLIVTIVYLIPFINILAFMVVMITGTGIILTYLESSKLFER